jgi:hypothetical protein
VVLPLDTSGDVGRPQTLTAGDGVQLASIAVDRGHALVSWTAKGAGDDHVPWWRLINLDGSATPPAQVLSSRYASPLRLGLTRSYGLAVWEQSTVGPGAPSEEIHARHVYR